jgi:hypothetical protein
MPTVSLPVPGELLFFLFSLNNSCIHSLFLKFSKFATVYVGFVIYVSLSEDVDFRLAIKICLLTQFEQRDINEVARYVFHLPSEL